MTTFRSVCDAPGRVRAASGAGVEVTTPRGTPGLRIWVRACNRKYTPRDAIDAPRRRNKAPRDAKERIKGP